MSRVPPHAGLARDAGPQARRRRADAGASASSRQAHKTARECACVHATRALRGPGRAHTAADGTGARNSWLPPALLPSCKQARDEPPPPDATRCARGRPLDGARTKPCAITRSKSWRAGHIASCQSS